MPRRPDTPCAACGGLLWTGSSSREQPICQPCRRVKVTVPCPVCDGTFEFFPYRKRRPVVCSTSCAAVVAVQAREPGRCRVRPCKACGDPVLTLGAVVLCVPCRELRVREQWERNSRRRRALLREVASEPYTLTEIAQRDGFRCQLCAWPVDMTLKSPDPMSPSIDHVEPLIKGGDDTRLNVQLAHRLCNLRKGARVPQQLMPVG